MIYPLTVAYDGTLIASRIPAKQWDMVGATYSDRGGIPYNAQFNLEVLQSPNLDAARYRVGGAKFPIFKVLTIFPEISYTAACNTARMMELCKGDMVKLTTGVGNTAITKRCVVIDCVANANAKRVLNGTALIQDAGGPPGAPGGAQTTVASVDTSWTLQVIAQ